jgi:ribosomal protein S27E
VPFPLSKVRHLNDYQGMFTLSVRCKSCRHERPLAAQMLAKHAGKDARVLDVVARLRCSRCGHRHVEALVFGIPR